MDERGKRKLWFRTSIGVFIYYDWFPFFTKLGELIPIDAKTAMYGSLELLNRMLIHYHQLYCRVYDYSLIKKGIEFININCIVGYMIIA